MTVIRSKNQVVISGRRNESDPWPLCMFQKNMDGTVVQTQFNALCRHYWFFHCQDLITVMRNGKELLGVSCTECEDIKLVDMETKQITCTFKCAPPHPYKMCYGPNGAMFTYGGAKKILTVNTFFPVMNEFYTGLNQSLSICYLPTCPCLQSRKH